MNEKTKIKNFYTASEICEVVFQGTLSKTTVHQLLKKGEIPSVEFLTKKLVPAWWVDQCLAKAHNNETAVAEVEQ